MNLSIPDMSCGHCRQSITSALTELDPAGDVTFDMEKRQIHVQTSSSPADVIEQLSKIGFDAVEI